jgi:ubiquinone/menaquinone biosynthesis C-methylase UbiE
MDEIEAGKYWERNAASWTTLARAGYDVYRDFVNTPAFLELLPPVAGMKGLDVGCGDGHNTRLLSEAGAAMYAIDIAPAFVRAAVERERERLIGVRYLVASAGHLPFATGSFDFATAFMSLMDMPSPWLALSEAHRVLRHGGFLQFSITHPCFNPPHRKLLRDANRKEYAVEVGRYFDRIDGRIDEWLFSAAPSKAKSGLRPFRVPQFHRTLSEWVNMIVDAGFQIERLAEPFADEETAARCPAVRDTRVVAYFLHVRCRKA